MNLILLFSIILRVSSKLIQIYDNSKNLSIADGASNLK